MQAGIGLFSGFAAVMSCNLRMLYPTLSGALQLMRKENQSTTDLIGATFCSIFKENHSFKIQLRKPLPSISRRR
jgi:hypothetical protein